VGACGTGALALRQANRSRSTPLHPTNKPRVRRLIWQIGRVVGTTRFIPKGKFHAIPKTELIVNHSQVILDHMFGCANGLRHLTVLQTFCDKLDDPLLAFTGDAASITFSC